jgi:hypothetical protein
LRLDTDERGSLFDGSDIKQCSTASWASATISSMDCGKASPL